MSVSNIKKEKPFLCEVFFTILHYRMNIANMNDKTCKKEKLHPKSVAKKKTEKSSKTHCSIHQRNIS